MDTDGKPVTGANVSVAYQEDYTDTSHRTQTAADGTFELDLAFIGSHGKKRALAYTLAASKGETIGYWESNSFGNPRTDEAINIILEPGVRFRGEVIDENNEPIAGVRIGNFTYNIHEVMSDANGQFDIFIKKNEALLKNHNIWLWAFKEGYALKSQPLGTNENVIVCLSEKRNKVVFRAVDAEGKPVPDIYFRPWCFFYKKDIQSAFQKSRLTTSSINANTTLVLKTDAQGRVVFDCIPSQAGDSIYCLCHNDKRLSPSAQLEFDPSVDFNGEIQVEMLAPGKLGGTLRNEEGKPLANTMIKLHSHLINDSEKVYSNSFVDTTKTDDQGKYEFLVYSDSVYPPPKIIDSNQLAFQIVGKDSDNRVVHSGESITDFDFIAEKTYRVHGKVILPPDFETTRIQDYRPIGGGAAVILLIFCEGEKYSLGSPKLKAIDSKGNEFEYFGIGESPNVGRVYAEYKKDESVEYEVWLPKGRFTAGFSVEDKTFDVSGDTPEVIIDLKLKVIEPIWRPAPQQESPLQRLIQWFL